jgi:DNA-binding GntR family transcriptional regulator
VLLHARIFALLAARDGARLRKLLATHLEHKRDAVLALMGGAEGGGADGRRA